MRLQQPPWNTFAITAAVSVLAIACLTVSIGAVRATGTGQPGSHSHMRQHKHGSGDTHRHHVPKRKHVQPPPKIPENRQDPKRLPREELSNPQLLQDNELFHDREHLKEELPEYLNLEKIEEMSDQELDFHYFRMHDFDKNLLLDGLELLAALGHVVGEEDEEEEGEGEGGDEELGAGGGEEEEKKSRVEDLKGLSEEEKRVVRNFRYQKWEDDWKFYIDLVDGVLENNDLNKDGFLSWTEFLKGRKRNI